MFSMVRRHDVQVLLAAGVRQARIREVLGISERSIRRIGTEEPVAGIEGDAGKRPTVGRPSKTSHFEALVKEWLTEKPDLKSVEIVHRLRQRGYGGQKSAAYELIASLRSKVARFVMRFEGLPGEFTQHDLGEVVVKFADGRRQRIHFFASRLKYSRTLAVTVVPNQRAETVVRTMLAHFALFGGIPLLAVFDRPKTIASAWTKDGRVTKWNPTFARAMFMVGLGVELCWPYQPQQKGSVENLVGWVKGSFFSQRRFVDYDDLLQQLEEWLVEVNTQRPCRATGVVPSQRLAADQARLRPLRVSPEDFALHFDASVGPTAEVPFEGAIYSVSPDAIGLPAELRVYPDRIQIVAGRHVSLHRRLEAGGRSILPEHRAERVAAVSGRRGKRYLKRQHLLELGDETFSYMSELVHRRPGNWFRDVDLMHELLLSEGADVVRRAINHALARDLYGGEYVRWFIDHPDDAGAAVSS